MHLRSAFVTALLFATACAGDVEDIDRTQPGKLKKSALSGEWYFRQTVVDVPFTAGITFIGEQSVMDRVRFEIAEDLLTAYRTYERVQGSERPSDLPGTSYQGAPVAAFRIVSHFDVARTYNEATGEQTNVIVENDTDRPWYERDYIRVDWSQNLLANFDLLAGGASGLNVRAQSASYAVTNPEDPDAPVFGSRVGDGWVDERDPMKWGELARVDYFDLTLKLQVTPDTFEVWYDDGTTERWPACWFYEYGPWDCASSTVKLRAAFMRVAPSDYEPLHYPDNYIPRDAEGHAIRVGWDDAAGELRRCTRQDTIACDTVRVPMFDWFGYFRVERETYDRDYEVTENGRVYLANRFNIWQRTRTSGGELIPMHLRRPRPITYYLSAEHPEALLDVAQEVATWWHEPFAETVASVTGSEAPTMFELRPNGFRAEDGRIVAHGQRNGDLRYSQLYWVDAPQMESLLGYGPASPDPLTGEIIVADAYVYGAAIDSYAAYGADVIDLMRGDILEDEFISGESVGAALSRLNAPAMSGADARERVRGVMGHGLAERLASVRRLGKQAFKAGHDVTRARLALGDHDARFDALWNDELRAAAEPRFRRKLEPSEHNVARIARALRRHRQELGKRAVDLGTFGDDAFLAAFERLKTLPRDEVVATLRADLFKSTATHEIGHSVGLRHNFAASTDALNYFDAYWEARNPDAQALDLPSAAEQRLGVRETAYSSIMDYGAKLVSDVRGLGKYDKAAVKFGYGQLVEAFVKPPDWQEHAVLSWDSLKNVVWNYTHYTDLPALFASIAGGGDGVVNMRERVDVPMQEVVDWMTLAPEADDFTDTLVPYKFCSDEYVGAKWDCDVFDEGADPYEITQHAAQSWRDYYIFRAFKRHRRYLDPWDYYVGTYLRYMLPMAQQYHQWLYAQWYQGWDWGYLHEWLNDPASGYSPTQVAEAVADPDWNLDPHGGLAYAAAGMTAMNFLAEVVGAPEPGSYFKSPDDPSLMWWWTSDEDALCTAGQDSSVDYCSDAYVPVGVGRYASSQYDADSGYYFYERVKVVGSFWDKLAAIETLADPTAYILGVDSDADATTWILGFNVAFPHAVGTLFGALVNDDYKYFAPALEADGSMSRPPILDGIQDAYHDTPGETLATRTGPFFDPANWTVSIYTLYYGMALLNYGLDQTFNDGAKIWLDGSGEAFTPPATATVASFVSPFNGRTYHAMKMPDPYAYSLGFEMVSKAERLREEVAANDVPPPEVSCFVAAAGTAACEPLLGKIWALQNTIENIELVRGYYDIFGYAWW